MTRGLGSMRRGAVVASGLQGLGVASRYAAQLGLARWAGPTAFGQWVYTTNFAQLVATPADAGLATAVTRFIPQAVADDDRNEQLKLLRTSRTATLGLGLVMAGLTATAVAIAGGSVTPLKVMLISLAVTPLYGLIELQSGLCRSYERFVSAYLPSLVLQPLLLLAVIGVWAASGSPSATVLVSVTCVAVAAVIGMQAWSLHRLRPAGQAGRVSRADLRRWGSVSLPLLVLSLSNLVFSRLDLVLVGAFLGAGKAGVYSVAFRTAAVAALVQTGISAVITPRMARLFWSGNRRELEHTLLAGTRWIVLASTAVTVPLIVFRHSILGLFGHSFRDGATAMTVYLVGQLVAVCAGPVGWLLAITGHHRRASSIAVTSAALTVTAYLVLIPWIGLIGAAAANSLGMVIRNLWSNVEVRRQLGFRIDPVRAFMVGRAEEES